MLDLNNKYHIYHIPGKKIGITCNLNNRVTTQQGYKQNEYEVLESSDDIEYISRREHQLQAKYGYKVDSQLYINLIKNKFNKPKMNNIKMPSTSDATTTFYCALVDLKSFLLENHGLKWNMPWGEEVELTFTNIEWILRNANVSQFGDDKCYIYNKAFIDNIIDRKNEEQITIDVETDDYKYFPLIRDWAKEKGIFEKGDSKTQYVKLMEEAGELAKALLNNDKAEILDAIGDIVVVLTNLSHLEGFKIEECIESAYNVIKVRQGEMINGTFVKRASL